MRTTTTQADASLTEAEREAVSHLEVFMTTTIRITEKYSEEATIVLTDEELQPQIWGLRHVLDSEAEAVLRRLAALPQDPLVETAKKSVPFWIECCVSGFKKNCATKRQS